jgi:hypothetical protein
MSEEPLQRAEQAIKDGHEAAGAAPIMPFGDTDEAAGDEPEETGGAVAQHGNDEPEAPAEEGSDDARAGTADHPDEEGEAEGED